MAYPTLAWMEEGTEIRREGGIVVDRAEDGSTHTRSSWSADARTIRAVHILKQTDRDTLVSFYNSNKTTTFSVTIPGSGETVNARFASALDGADVLRPSMGLRYRITVDMAIV
jgi:hypothetical protein